MRCYRCYYFWSLILFTSLPLLQIFIIETKSRHNLNHNSINSHFVSHFSSLFSHCRIKPLSTSLQACFLFRKKIASIFPLVHTMYSINSIRYGLESWISNACANGEQLAMCVVGTVTKNKNNNYNNLNEQSQSKQTPPATSKQIEKDL